MVKAYENNSLYVLSTKNTTYCVKVNDKGHLMHFYYGKRITLFDSDAISPKTAFIPGNMVAYTEDDKTYALENISLEISSPGKGDVRDNSLVLEYEDGSYTSDFVYAGAVFLNKLERKNGYDLPHAKKPDDELIVTLKEKVHDVKVEIIYSVFEESDVITRRMRIINRENSLTIKKAMSLQLDMQDENYDFISFNGAWAREMSFDRKTCGGTTIAVSSRCGFSSNRFNPFVMIVRPNTDEHIGEGFAFNLVYSGNHLESVSSAQGKLRFLSGINPEGFSYKLLKDTHFDVPEAVMTYSDKGLNGISKNMHHFVRNHISPESFAFKEKKILLNSWEASYFKFNQKSLLAMAKDAAKLGIELFVLDDGWFGKRDDDTSSLGDWKCNTKKLPNDLKGLAKKINSLGMGFGIWMEPEMISVNSELYKKHPDWAVDIPDREHSEGRHQRFLDLTRNDVRDYIVESISDVLNSAKIEYVKWDMNRVFSDMFSKELNNQEEFCHRYILGLYDILGRITNAFPHILFEGCASGGNRFDLGALCFFSQIWASDNTDAWCRAGIQNSYTYGYPLSVISAHVSGIPNHQTLRRTPLMSRFNVASFGVLGYECNIADLSKEDKEEIKEQIEWYKKYRHLFMTGDFYRIASPCTNVVRYDKDMQYQWLVVSQDKSEAIFMTFHDKAVANYPMARVKCIYLDDSKKYHFTNIAHKINVKNFGDLVNTVSPIHVKPDSFVHNTIARFVKMDSEVEDYVAYGDVINNCGIVLHDNYAAVGYDGNVRYYQDYSSRMYVILEEKSDGH